MYSILSGIHCSCQGVDSSILVQCFLFLKQTSCFKKEFSVSRCAEKEHETHIGLKTLLQMPHWKPSALHLNVFVAIRWSDTTLVQNWNSWTVALGLGLAIQSMMSMLVISSWWLPVHSILHIQEFPKSFGLPICEIIESQCPPSPDNPLGFGMVFLFSQGSTHTSTHSPVVTPGRWAVCLARPTRRPPRSASPSTTSSPGTTWDSSAWRATTWLRGSTPNLSWGSQVRPKMRVEHHTWEIYKDENCPLSSHAPLASSSFPSSYIPSCRYFQIGKSGTDLIFVIGVWCLVLYRVQKHAVSEENHFGSTKVNFWRPCTHGIAREEDFIYLSFGIQLCMLHQIAC